MLRPGANASSSSSTTSPLGTAQLIELGPSQSVSSGQVLLLSSENDTRLHEVSTLPGPVYVIQEATTTTPITKILNDVPEEASIEDKFKFLAHKYAESEGASQKLTQENYELQRKVALFTEEFHQMETDRNKLLAQKEKLENLCRELQKYANDIKDENISRVKTEEERRKEIADHLQSSISNIQDQLGTYQESNENLRKENSELAEKLHKFISQYEANEQHTAKILQAKDLEVKLAQAKLEQRSALAEQEKLQDTKKAALLEKRIAELEKEIANRLTEEIKLKEAIEGYQKQYETFSKSINKNHGVVEKARKDIDGLATRCVKAEKDSVYWFDKWNNLREEHAKAIEDEIKLRQELASKSKQVESLSNLCRTLKAMKVDEKPQPN
ncbi:hypothetical protein Ciccas_000372 [Cichlidogyrus casuarinus]|uniref:Transforming acidic coiled-coil-containing protein C-terminal domain-containing protein n=1 Tax=Cichlidogyrus casuarinus TaxID=1844966 RepID=A0ABD2QN54_9PLAT